MISAPDFSKLVDSSMEELRLKTTAAQGWGLGKFARWGLNMDDGVLVFSNPDGYTASGPAQIIGSFDSLDNTWLWGWDNPSVPDALKKDALKVKAYGEQNGITKLTTAKWTATESNAWEMVALATKLCGSQGAYRGPAGTTFVFITFGTVQIEKGK
jgi:hypothetical protein